MSFRDDLAGVLARDPRYSIQAYAFMFEALEHTKALRRKARTQSGPKRRRSGDVSQHVTGRELCLGARDMALRHYGLMALAVLHQWGIRSTSDIGEIIYNLIGSGDLEKTPADSRADFDDVFDFEDALRRHYVVPLDHVA